MHGSELGFPRRYGKDYENGKSFRMKLGK